MRSDMWVKAALAIVGVCTSGSLAGMGLANYVASGTFEFYKQPRVAEWRPDPRPASSVATGDLAFASAYRSGGQVAEPGRDFAAFTD